jgi:amino acid transporter
MVLHGKQPQLLYKFNLRYPTLIGCLGFICCTWLIYWSGCTNLVYLFITLTLIVVGYYAFHAKKETFHNTLVKNWYLLIYLASLVVVSFLRFKHMIPFPEDNLIIAAIGLIFAYIFRKNSLSSLDLEQNLIKIREEMASE